MDDYKRIAKQRHEALQLRKQQQQHQEQHQQQQEAHLEQPRADVGAASPSASTSSQAQANRVASPAARAPSHEHEQVDDVVSPATVEVGAVAEPNPQPASPAGSGQELESEFECPLCLKLLYDPVTTPACAHTFCRACMVQALEMKRACPICRAPCNIDPLSHPTAHLIARVLEKTYAQQYRERKKEAAVEKRERRPTFGLFVGDFTQFPRQPLRLHVFEPRYRVLVNRAIASHRQFVVVNGALPQNALAFKELLNRPSGERDELKQPQQQQHRQPPQLEEDRNANELRRRVVQAQEQQQPQRHQPQQEQQEAQQHQQQAQQQQSGLARSERAAQVHLAPPPSEAANSHLVGCLVRITRCATFADGRSLVEGEGTQRVRVLGVRTDDDATAFGLQLAEIEPVPDSESAYEERALEWQLQHEEQQPHEQQHQQQQGADQKQQNNQPAVLRPNGQIDLVQRTLVEGIHKSLGRYCVAKGILINRITALHGELPVDPTELVFWLCRAIDGDSALKERCLRSRSVIERLQLALEVLRTARMKAQSNARWIGAALLALLIYMIYSYWGTTDGFRHHLLSF